MPPGNNKWDKGRKAQQTRALRRLLILCEDTKSSRDYLKQFPVDGRQIQIECQGTGMNTDSLMAEAIKRKEKAERDKAPYESIWVVFDKDDFPLQNFNRAFDLARPHPTIHPCWANECFELWYLLHFELRQTDIARKKVWKEISAYLKASYDKADVKVFAALEPHLKTALTNAQRLEFINAELADRRRNPSTNVHILIKHLLALNPGLQKT